MYDTENGVIVLNFRNVLYIFEFKLKMQLITYRSSIALIQYIHRMYANYKYSEILNYRNSKRIKSF